LSQLLSKVIVASAVFTSNVQCVRLAARRRTLKCVVTEVVLLSVVALRNTDISQGSEATHLRCGRICICNSTLLQIFSWLW